MSNIEDDIVARYATRGNAWRITVLRNADVESLLRRVPRSSQHRWRSRRTLGGVMLAVASIIADASEIDGLVFHQTPARSAAYDHAHSQSRHRDRRHPGLPSKMPGTSYGLPATACITGAKLARVAGSTCSDCYALKGNYVYPSVEQSQATRLALIDNPAWVPAMVTLLTRTHATGKGRNGPISKGWHRWHDLGDIQSADHLGKIAAVAFLTPQIKHWLPTRELKILQQYLAQGGTIPHNLTVRVQRDHG